MKKARALSIVVMSIALVVSAGCRRSELADAWRGDEPSPAVDASTAAEDARAAEEERREELRLAEEARIAAEAEADAARQELAELEAALAEQQARAAAREAELAAARERESERARLAARQAEIDRAARELELEARELEERERVLEAREFDVTVREDALAEGYGDEVAPADRGVESGSEAPIAGPASGGASGDQRRTVTASLEPGKVLEIEIMETVSSRTHRVGDTFTARLVQDLRNEAGVLVIAAGAEIRGEVTHVKPLKKVGGRAELGIEFTHVEVRPGETMRIRASLVEFGKDKRKDKRRILIATAAGAILGRVLGGDTEGAVAGAAVGAAASTAVAATAEGKDAEIPAGEKIALQLEEVVTVEVEMTGPADSWRP